MFVCLFCLQPKLNLTQLNLVTGSDFQPNKTFEMTYKQVNNSHMTFDILISAQNESLHPKAAHPLKAAARFLPLFLQFQP